MEKKNYILILIPIILVGISGLFFEVDVPKCNEGSKLIDGHYCMDMYSEATTVGLAGMKKDSAFTNLTLPLMALFLGLWFAFYYGIVDTGLK